MNENFKVIKTFIPEFIAQYSSFDIELLVPETFYEETDAFTMTFKRPDGFVTTELSGEFDAQETVEGVDYFVFIFKITPYHTNLIPGQFPTGTAYIGFRFTRTAEVNGDIVTTDTASSGQTKLTIHRAIEPITEVFADS